MPLKVVCNVHSASLQLLSLDVFKSVLVMRAPALIYVVLVAIIQVELSKY